MPEPDPDQLEETVLPPQPAPMDPAAGGPTGDGDEADDAGTTQDDEPV